ncbi:MAG: hypothetical protein EXQ56_07565 [Acidobacteria bacterium]|nr:hypothetical protein [Acidobacteriota bacterium]
MRTGHVQHTATLLADGKVLIVGGDIGPCGGWALGTELYDWTKGTFTPTGRMTIGRRGHTATLLVNGKVLIAGGFRNPNYLSSAEIYDPITETFRPIPGNMIWTRADHSATLLPEGKVLITGGLTSTPHGGGICTAEIFDPSDPPEILYQSL